MNWTGSGQDHIKCASRASGSGLGIPEQRPARDALRRRVPSRSSDGEAPTALEPTRIQHFSPVACTHALAKPVFTLTRQALGLPCSFHGTTFNHFLADILHDYTALRLTCQTHSPIFARRVRFQAPRLAPQRRYRVGRMIRREMRRERYGNGGFLTTHFTTLPTDNSPKIAITRQNICCKESPACANRYSRQHAARPR